ncbi:MAG: cobyric acid synthase, partial [Acidimicrobiales bacterium]
MPRASNLNDVDALRAEPGVSVRITADPGHVACCDLAVIPGTRATVGDLSWMNERGIDHALRERVRAGQPTLGICGGYQMLARWIDDTFASRRGRTAGLGFLPTTVTFHAQKRTETTRESWRDLTFDGYRIHHGEATPDPGAALELFAGGVRSGEVGH